LRKTVFFNAGEGTWEVTIKTKPVGTRKKEGCSPFEAESTERVYLRGLSLRFMKKIKG